MIKFFKLLAIFLITNCFVNLTYGQKKDSTYVGTATGILRDSLRNYVLQGATISVYKIADDELVSYQLSNNFGRFQFKMLPVGIPLKMIATYIGYNPAVKEFTVPVKIHEIDLNTFNLTHVNVLLAEVKVLAKIPPMQMRGDTLEFNADAFKLDSNAVVEDMLRKLPGITIWNDGVITVNGRKINKLLVEGKEFFGGGSKIALQNLAKNAVKKIQVYQDGNNSDPTNPSTNMNILLKKDKKSGYFGKLGAGGGTGKHFDDNGMISLFTPQVQLSVVGATNDVNKTANSVSSLVELNSFKGEGINNDYYSDFTRQGQNVYKAAGLSLLYDFNKTKTEQTKTNIIKTDYFLRDATNDITQATQTLVTINPDEHLQQTAWSANKSNYLLQNASLSYNRDFDKNSFSATYYQQNNRSKSFYQQENTSSDDLSLAQSKNRTEQNYSSAQDVVGGNVKLTTIRYQDLAANKNKSFNMELNYLFDVNHTNEETNRITDFTATDTTQNKYFNRRYLTKSQNTSHTIVSNFNDIIGLLQRHTPYFQTDVKNSIAFYDYKRNNDVNDLGRNGSQYIPNTNLTNISDNQIMNDRPGLNFSKTVTSILDNRYNKTWRMSVFAQGDVYIQKNISQKDFQNLRRSYFYFIPSAQISHLNFKYGGSRKSYTLTYSTSVNYPGVNQLAPLIDNADVYNIYYGNINLKPAYKQDLSFNYTYANGIDKKPFSGNLELSAGLVDNFIADSSYYDALGRTVHYPINVAGNRYAAFKGSFQKAYKLKDHQFQLAGNTGYNYYQNPASLNGKYYTSKTNSLYASTDLVYTYKGLLTTNIGEAYSGNKTVQENFGRYTFHTWRTYSNVLVNLPQKIAFGTRVDFNNSKSSNANNIYYTIWNVDASFRFLKGANGEIKFSALDLLHQNKNIINYAGNNSITSGTVNVLQQYFMVTLAYYPRKFGFGKK